MDFISSGIAWPILAWGVAGALILAGAVAVDARERGQSAALWFVLALLFPGFGALAYLVLRPTAETATLPAPSFHDRPAGVSLSAGAARGSVPTREAARAEPAPGRDIAPPEASPPRAPTWPEPPPARDVARPESPAAREAGGREPPPRRDEPRPEPAAPRAEPRPDGPPSRPPARASTLPEASRGGVVEWRRGVGVLGGEAAPPAPPPPEPQARPAPARAGRGVPPWLIGAVVALALLVAAGVGLSRFGPALAPAPAPATAVPAPTAAPPPEPTAAPAPTAAPERPTSYTVEDGDTLGGIAAQFDTTIDALMEANGIDDADTVFVGQQLTIPPQ
ncbi:MAG TPA: LysM peptidoglycan-binding domain-containing protein [Chloroflexota bacterium]|jgi:hypothetical protein